MLCVVVTTLLLVSLTSARYRDCTKIRLVDLSHVIGPDTVYWPGNPEFNFTILHRGFLNPPGFWLERNFFSTAEHGGTHFDAPAHFYEGSWRSHQIPVDNLVGPGVIIDVRQQASKNPDYRVTKRDLKQWERKYNKIPKGAVVIMNSGWDKNYPNKTLTFGSDNPHDHKTFHFPGFHEEAANWLVQHRNIHVIGVDTPSLDYGQSITAPVHVIMGKENIPGLENVANLDTIPESGTIIITGAIKLYDGSGGPARVIAMLFEDPEEDS